MLKAALIGIAAALALGGAAMAKPPASAPSSPELLLVKDNGHGRKLGHHKWKDERRHYHGHRDWHRRDYSYRGWRRDYGYHRDWHRRGPPSWAPAYGYYGSSRPSYYWGW